MVGQGLKVLQQDECLVVLKYSLTTVGMAHMALEGPRIGPGINAFSEYASALGQGLGH